MKTIALVRAHARVTLCQLFRTPAYAVPTLLFPALFYALFDMQYARKDAFVAGATTLSFIAFAVIGVALFQFGIGIAQERGRPWERYLRTLPAPAWVRFSARVIAALVFGLLSAGIVGAISRMFTPIDLSLADWLRVAAYTTGAAVPFVLMGIALGYWCSPRAAIPIANLLNLVLAYAGGLWIPQRWRRFFERRIASR
jgi:ABC-2 type transport system permease protein